MPRSCRSFLKMGRYRLEAWGVNIFLKISRLFSLETASSLGKSLGQLIGPHHKVSRIAQRNLLRVFPHYSEEERALILHNMWENLGRNVMEYARITAFLSPQEQGRIHLHGEDIIQKIQQTQKPAIFFSAHLANWQMITLAARQQGLALIQLYRSPNNPFFEKIMQNLQEKVTDGTITKGQGARAMVRALQKGKHVLIFVDQKLNDGISVPFLGHPAMTASAVARLAQKFECPLIPVRIERLEGPSFRVTFYESLSLEGTEYDIMVRVNALLGEWILERPEQWFWVHNRWPSATEERNHPIS